MSAHSESSRQTVRRRLVGGGVWAVVGKGGTLGLNFVVMALVTRLLDPTEAGAYLLSQVLVNAAALVARLGLENTAIFLVSNAVGSDRPGRALGAVRRVMSIGVASALVVLAVLSLGGAEWIARHMFHKELVARAAWLLGPWAAAVALQILLSETFRGFHAIREAALFGGVVSGVLTLAGFGVLHLRGPLSLEAAVSAAALAVTASAAFAATALWFRLRPLAARAVPEPVEGVLADALPVLGSNLTAFVILNVDVWVIGSCLPEREVAIYAAAARLVTLIGLGAVIGNQVLPPIIGELHAKGEQRLMERALRGVAFLVSIPAVAATAVFVFAAPVVLRLAFGPFYEAGAGILRVLSIGWLASVVTGSTAYTLLMTGHQVASFWLSIGSAAGAVIGSLVAVRYAGALGVAWAIAGVLVVQQVGTLVACRGLVGVWTHASPKAVGAELRRIWSRGAIDAPGSISFGSPVRPLAKVMNLGIRAREKLKATVTDSSLLVSVTYAAVATWVCARTGHLSLLGDERLLFQTHDAQAYRTYADFFAAIGNAPLPTEHVLTLRPFLYPLFLALYVPLGIAAFQALQLLLTAAAVGLVHRAVRREAGAAAAFAAAGIFALTPSVTFIGFHALTESLTLFCVAALLNANWWREPGHRPSFLPAFLLCMLALLRGQFLPAWAIVMGVTIVRAFRRRVPRAGLLALASLSPILAQLAISTALVGAPSITKAGSQNLQYIFFPSVLRKQERGIFLDPRDEIDARAEKDFPTSGGRAWYMASHPAATSATFFHNLVDENIATNSHFATTRVRVSKASARLQHDIASYSEELNRGFLWTHLVFSLLSVFTIAVNWGPAGKHLLLLYAFTVSVIASSAIVHHQGDRIVLVAEPIWLFCYASVLRSLIVKLQERRSRTG